MPSVDKELVSIINILSLVKQEPKTWLQLWNSGCFIHPALLNRGLKGLGKAGCLDFQDVGGINLISLTGVGIRFLDCFPGWKPYKVRKNVSNIDGIITRRLVEEGFMVKVSKGVYKISPDLLLSHGRIVKIRRSEKSNER